MRFDLDKPVYVNMFGKHTQTSGYWEKKRSITSNLMIYVISGSFDMLIDDTVYHASQGDVLLIPANVFSQPLKCDATSYYFLHFIASVTDKEPTGFHNVISSFRDDGPIGYIYNYYGYLGLRNYDSVVEIQTHTKNTTSNRIEEVFKRAAQINIWNNNAEKLLIDNIAREILICLNVDFIQNSNTNSTLQKILLYINRHFSEDISLCQISENFGISYSYITKLFRTYIGMGTVDYINNLRLTYACEKLISSNNTIGEISNSVGFSNQYYFNRLFRRKYGITPNEFRKSNT